MRRFSTPAAPVVAGATALLLAISGTTVATASDFSTTGSVSSAGSTVSSNPVDALVNGARAMVYSVTDSEFVRAPLAHGILELNKSTPVVILGAQINEDCSLPQVLEDRLDAATTLLKSHPSNPVIVTGGSSSQWPGTSEAQAMEKALQERGVTNRVILENNAWNTLQNVEYTAGTIKQLGGTAIVVTSDPHYIRALKNYRDAGIRAFGYVGGKG